MKTYRLYIPEEWNAYLLRDPLEECLVYEHPGKNNAYLENPSQYINAEDFFRDMLFEYRGDDS